MGTVADAFTAAFVDGVAPIKSAARALGATIEAAIAVAIGPPAGVTARVVTAAGDVTIDASDSLVVIKKSVGAATTVNLPSSPTTASKFIIKDGKGDASTNNITLTPATGLIDDAASYPMIGDYQSVTIQYDGTQWRVIG